LSKQVNGQSAGRIEEAETGIAPRLSTSKAESPSGFSSYSTLKVVQTVDSFY